MRTIVFKRAARELICSQRAGLLKTPLKMMTARVQELMKYAASLGFGFAGPVFSSMYAPHLVAYCWYQVPFAGRIYKGMISCWVDGAVALEIAEKERIVFGLRIDRSGKLTQHDEQDGRPKTENNFTQLGELLSRVEKEVAVRYAGGIPDGIDDVYILTAADRLICRASAGKRPDERRTAATKNIIRVLKLRGRLHGYVHVSGGWVVKRSDATLRRPTLIFSAFGTRVTRVRIYELAERSGRRRVSRLLGAYERINRVDGGD